MGFVVGVAVFVAVAELFHELGGGVAHVRRYFGAFVGFDQGAGLVVGVVTDVAFGGHGQVEHGLTQGEFPNLRSGGPAHLSE